MPIYTNAFGIQSLSNPLDNLSAYHDDEFVMNSHLDVRQIVDGDYVNIGNINLEIFETPGHDLSCICYKVNIWLFTGDAYISGCKVFTKLQNGDNKLSQISTKRIMEMIQDNFVYPGHYIEKNL